jgi:superoxide dismutase, Fe-Mn family
MKICKGGFLLVERYLDDLLKWSLQLYNTSNNKKVRQLIEEINVLKANENVDFKKLEKLDKLAKNIYLDTQSNYYRGNVSLGEHILPPLPYSYNSLEPYIDERIMRLHYEKHHKGYVDGLNKAEKEIQKAREYNNYDLIKHWERELAFNGSGHYLHTLFWYVMSPKGGGKPKGQLLQRIERDFGSFQTFKQQFSAVAKQVEGVGWAILVWSPRSHRLEILQAEKHQNLTQWGTIPLLVIDVWEHAYYLQYENKREQYINQWWNVVNWDYVSKRFKEAKKLTWKQY